MILLTSLSSVASTTDTILVCVVENNIIPFSSMEWEGVHQSPTEELWTTDGLWGRKSQFKRLAPSRSTAALPGGPTPRSTLKLMGHPSMGLGRRVNLGGTGRKI